MRAERARFLHAQFEWLRENEEKPYRLDPRSLSRRHIDSILAHWQEEAKAGRISPATIRVNFEYLKSFSCWIGRPNLMKPIEQYFDDLALYNRRPIGVTDKRGTVVEQLLAEAIQLDQYAGMALKLMAAFRLSFKEACLFDPAEDVMQCSPKSPNSSVVTHRIDTHREPKRGRERFIPITTAAQRDAIELAKQVAMEQEARGMGGHPTLSEAIYRTRYVMQQLGLTKQDLLATHHGVRQERSTDASEAVGGVAAKAVENPMNDASDQDRSRTS